MPTPHDETDSYAEPPLVEWADWLDCVRREERLQLVQRPVVIAETASTQDAARRLAGDRAGVLVVADRQTAGRGRLGRRWFDSARAGLAMSFALRLEPHQLAILSPALAVAVADAIEQALASPGNPYRTDDLEVAIRWPNDIVTARSAGKSMLARRADASLSSLFRHQSARGPQPLGPATEPPERSPHCRLAPALLEGRKLAGVLVEQTGDLAVIGVGVNVAHAEGDWPPDLRQRAVSIRQLGSDWSRLDLADRVMTEVDRRLRQPPESILAAFAARDCLRARRATFLHDSRRFVGVVESIDPAGAVRLRLDDGSIAELPAQTTSVVHE